MEKLFDTHDYRTEDVAMFMAEDLDMVLDSNVVKTNGKVNSYILISKRLSERYGNQVSNHGMTGFKVLKTPTLSNALLDTRSDRVEVLVGDNRELKANYSDHDGTHYTTVKRVSESNAQKINNAIEYYTDFDNLLETLADLPTVRVRK